MEQKILDLIFEVCDDKIIYTKRDVNMFDTGLLESMDFIELLMAIEEEFDIEIPDEDAEKFQLVGDLVKYVEDQQQ